MATASCPKCREQVSLPEKAASSSQVRCPWCAEEYPLREALGRLPPQLIVVQQGVERAVERDDLAGSKLPAASLASTEVDSFLDDSVFESRPETDLRHAKRSAVDSDTDLDMEDVDEIDYEVEDRRGDPGRQPAFAEDDWLSAAARQGSSTTADADRTTSRTSSMARGRPRRRQAGPIRSFIQIVAGGILGLAIAQLILWWLPGNWKANRDPLGIADDVAQYAPFLVPAKVLSTSTANASGTDAKGASASGTDAGNAEVKPKKRNADDLEPNLSLENSEVPSTAQQDRSLDPEESGNSSDSSAKPENEASADVPAETSPEGDSSGEIDAGEPNTKDSSKPGWARGIGGSGSASIAGESPNAKRPATPPADGAPGELRNASAVSAEQLTERLSAAKDAEDAWDRGTSAPKDERRKLFKDLYSTYASVGEALILLDPSESTDFTASEGVVRARQAIEDFTSQPVKLGLIGAYGPHWMDQEHDHTGMIVFGTVVDLQAKGKLIEARIKMAANTKWERDVAVVFKSDEIGSFGAGSRIVVFGTLVSDPSTSLVGYEGNADLVVLAGYHAAIEP